MNKQNIHVITEMLMQIKEVTKTHLPIGHSFIPYEMMLIVILHYLKGEELTVKRLFNSGSFSEMGNRYHFKKLIDKDWIILKDHPTDSRLKLIFPTSKLLSSFESITSELTHSFLSVAQQQLGMDGADKTQGSRRN
jgi:hypothetical protein